MSEYLFLFGRTPALSAQELAACVSAQSVQRLTNEFAVVNFEDDAEAVKVFGRLGGSLKVLRLEQTTPETSEEALTALLAEYLSKVKKPTFALAEIGRDAFPKLDVAEVKKILKKQDISARFIESSRGGLSAAVGLHQNVTELYVIADDQQTLIAKTLAVQNIDEWTARDRFKPYANRKKGMLPPKVARMMVNLALATQPEMKFSDIRVYDPFCGTGTVLLEAATLGCRIIGSDLDEEAVAGTKANISWLMQAQSQTITAKVIHGDAVQLQVGALDGEVDVIVTEPFLGKPKPKTEQLPNIYKGLEKLYMGVFKRWTSILKDGGAVVIITPLTELPNKRFSLEKLIDKIRPLGYTPLSEPVVYARPQAVVQRQIWTFRFTKQNTQK